MNTCQTCRQVLLTPSTVDLKKHPSMAEQNDATSDLSPYITYQTNIAKSGPS